MTIQLGWFSTGRGEGSRRLLTTVHESIQSGELDARIAFVFCSRDYGETEATDKFLHMVEGYHLPLVSYSYRKFKVERGIGETASPEALPVWRLEYDRQVMQRLQDFHPDLCILAGYMLVVGAEMCRKYDMINLHPAAPHGPAGTWQEVIWKLIESRATHTGVMMHLVIPELDKGPVVTYCTFPLRGKAFDKLWAEVEKTSLAEIKKQEGEENALFKLIRRYGFARELPLVVATIKAFSQGKVKITSDKRVVDASGAPVDGHDLSVEIDEAVKRTNPELA